MTKSFEFVIYQCLIFMASYEFCQAEFDFKSYGIYYIGIPNDDSIMADAGTPVWVHKYEGINRFDVISEKIADVEGAYTTNIIMSFKSDQVEPVLLYNEFSNIIITDESGHPEQYHFWFVGGRENTPNFIENIRPLPISGDIQLKFQIEKVIRVDEELDDISTLVESANIFERDIGNKVKTFTIRNKDSSKPYLIVASQQFHVSEPYGPRKNKVILFLSRAIQFKYVLVFLNKSTASNFTKKMKTYIPGKKFAKYDSNWNKYN